MTWNEIKLLLIALVALFTILGFSEFCTVEYRAYKPRKRIHRRGLNQLQ